MPVNRQIKNKQITLQQMTTSSFLKRSSHTTNIQPRFDPINVKAKQQAADDVTILYRFCSVQIQHLLASLHIVSASDVDWDIVWMEQFQNVFQIVKSIEGTLEVPNSLLLSVFQLISCFGTLISSKQINYAVKFDPFSLKCTPEVMQYIWMQMK